MESGGREEKASAVVTILAAVLEAVDRLIDFRRCYVAMYDRSRTEINYPLVAVKDRAAIIHVQFDEARPFMPNHVLPDCVFIRKSPILIRGSLEAWLDAEGFRHAAPINVPTPRSWLGAPLLARNRVLGTVVVEHTEKYNAFDERTQTTLAMICSRAASALSSHRLEENLKALNTVGLELASRIDITESEILYKIHEQVQSLMDTRDMYIALFDNDKQQLSFPLAYKDGVKEDDWPPRDVGPKPRGLTELVIHEEKPLCPEDVQSCYDLHQIVPEIKPVPKSWLGVPIMRGDDMIGVISLQNDEIQNLYEPDDVELLSTMAANAAIAISNIRSHRDAVRERTTQLEGLRKIGEATISRTRLPEVIESIAQNVKEVAGAHSVTVFSYNMQQAQFGIGVRFSEDFEQPSMPSSTGSTAKIAKEQKPRYVRDVNQELMVTSSFVEAEGIRAFAALPLVSGDRTVGVLFVNYLKPHRFTDSERDSLTMFANQAALALEHARILDELHELQVRARARDRLAITTRFAGQFIHQLTSVAGASPLWVRRIEDAVAGTHIVASVSPYIEALKSDLDKLGGMAEQYKQFLRRSVELTVDQEWVMLADLISEIVKEVLESMPDLRDKTQVETFCDPDNLAVWAFRQDMYSIVHNLVKNAFEAMPSGGICQIHYTLLEPNEIVQITVSDSGIGMSEEVKRRIFDSHFSTKGQLGFGLMETREAIVSMGGEIDVLTEPGMGTRFIVRLPVPFRSTI